MYSRSIALAALALAAAAVRPAAAQPCTDPRLAGVREQIRTSLRRDSVPSIAFGVALHGRVLCAEGFGFADLERREPATHRTRYALASLSKPITALGVLLLAERGRVDLNRPAAAYLPSDMALTGFAGPASSVTVRDLLQHRAGLPSPYVTRYLPGEAPPFATMVRRYGIITSPPGARYAYSNMGYGLLAALTARVDGRPYDRFLAEEIFAPLGMRGTTLEIGPRLSRPAAAMYGSDNRAHPYFVFDDWGSGRVWSTVDDMLRFGLFHLGHRPAGARPILPPAALRRMAEERRPSGTAGGRYGTDWFYALGWGGREASAASPYWYGHDGGVEGGTTELRILPDHDLVVVALSNRLDAPVKQIVNEAVDALVPGGRRMALRDSTRRPAPAARPVRPASLAGRWKGTVRAWSGEIPLELEIGAAAGSDSSLGVRFAGSGRAAASDVSWSARGVSFDAPGRLATPDLEGSPHALWYDLALEGDSLVGVVFAHTPTGRLPRVVLPSRVSLRREQAFAVAELYAPGVFSTGHYELTPSFTPDGGTAYYTVSTPAYGRLHVILERRRQGAGWGPPRVLPLSGRYGDADPFVSPDGRRFYFISKRPVDPAAGDAPRRDFEIWYAEREGDGWGAPRHVPEAGGPDAEHYVTATASGTLYIAAVRPDSRGRGDIYRVPFAGGRYGAPENLGPAINSPDHHDTTPYVSPDESYLIYSSWGRPDGRGTGGDLYVSFRRDGRWTEARPLGAGVNSTATEYCPLVAADGYLYFTSERGFADRPLAAPLAEGEWTRLIGSPGNGLGDVYRVRLADVMREMGAAPPP